MIIDIRQKSVYIILFIMLEIYLIPDKNVYKFVFQLFIILGDPKIYMYMVVSNFSDLINWNFVYNRPDKICKYLPQLVRHVWSHFQSCDSIFL